MATTCDVGELAADDICAFVRAHPDECGAHNSFIPYMEVFYCGLGGVGFGGITLLVLWVLLLFNVLGGVSERFFCAALMQLTERLKLSPNVAGVTLLAFGNGAPDIFSSYAAVSTGSLDQALGELVGAGVFVSTVVVGSVVLFSKPSEEGVRPTRRPFVRDMLFFIVGVGLVLGVLYDAVVSLVEAIALLLYYCAYVTTVFLGRYLYQRHIKPRQMALGQVFDDTTSVSSDSSDETDRSGSSSINGEPAPVLSSGHQPPLTDRPARKPAPPAIFVTPDSPAERLVDHASDSEAVGQFLSAGPSPHGRVLSHDDLLLMDQNDIDISTSLSRQRTLSTATAPRPDVGLDMRSTFQDSTPSTSIEVSAENSHGSMRSLIGRGEERGLRRRARPHYRRPELASNGATGRPSLKHKYTNEDFFLPRVGFYNQQHRHHKLDEELSDKHPAQDQFRGVGLLAALASATTQPFVAGAGLTRSASTVRKRAASTLDVSQASLSPLSQRRPTSMMFSDQDGHASQYSDAVFGNYDSTTAPLLQDMTRVDPESFSIDGNSRASIEEDDYDEDEEDERADIAQSVRPSELSLQFWKDYFDWDADSAWYSKVLFFLLLPISFCQMMTIPYVETGKYSRILSVVHPFSCAALLFGVFAGPSAFLWFAWLGVFGGAALLACGVVYLVTRPNYRAVVIMRSEDVNEGAKENTPLLGNVNKTPDIQMVNVIEQPPVLVVLDMILALVMSVIWIYVAANELVAVLQAGGLIFDISNAVLGLTVLAWGNSVADLISNTVVSRKGYPSMALGACAAAPLCNMLLGLGVALAIFDFKFGHFLIETRPAVPNVVILGSLVLFIALCLTLISVVLSGFRFPRWLGYVLIGIYLVFTVFGLLLELGVLLKGVSLFAIFSTAQ